MFYEVILKIGLKFRVQRFSYGRERANCRTSDVLGAQAAEWTEARGGHVCEEARLNQRFSGLSWKGQLIQPYDNLGRSVTITAPSFLNLRPGLFSGPAEGIPVILGVAKRWP
ncbi:MAG: hypothetical protein ACI87E_001335 [Mariniblastus sp.]